MYNTKAYSAASATSPLASTTIPRRDPTERDITFFDSIDFRSTLPRFTPDALKANQALIRPLGSIAGRKRATPAQITLAWLPAEKPWIVEQLERMTSR